MSFVWCKRLHFLDYSDKQIIIHVNTPHLNLRCIMWTHYCMLNYNTGFNLMLCKQNNLSIFICFNFMQQNWIKSQKKLWLWFMIKYIYLPCKYDLPDYRDCHPHWNEYWQQNFKTLRFSFQNYDLFPNHVIWITS